MNRPSRRAFLLWTLVSGSLTAIGATIACAPAPAAPPSEGKAAAPPAPTVAPSAPTTAATTPPKPAATAAPPTVAAPIKVNLGFIAGIFDNAYFIGARDAGVYARNGVDLNLTTYQDDVTSTRTLVTKETHVIEVSFNNPLSAIEKGSPLKVIGVSYARVPFIWFARKGIETLRDLDGKSSGIAAPNDLNQTLQLAVLRKHGLANLRVEFVPIGPTPQIVAALVAGKIDSGTGLFSHELQLRGNPDIHPLADISQELPDMPRFGPVVHQDTIAQQNSLLERFMLAHSAAWRWAMENRDGVIQAAVKTMGLDQQVATAAYDAPLTREGMITPDFTTTPAQIQQVQDLNIASQLQTKVVPFEQATDLRYVKLIAEKLGPYKVPVKKP